MKILPNLVTLVSSLIFDALKMSVFTDLISLD